MSEVIQFLSGDAVARLMVTLLHSLWQGGLIAGVLWVVLCRSTVRSTTRRYGAAGAALLVFVLCVLVTVA